jgi:tetratricopeptide (TPR) repeat protein
MKIKAGKKKEGLNSLTRLAGRFINQGYYRQALSLYYYVLRYRPKSLDCLLGAGRALEEMDFIADALNLLKRAQDVMSEGRVFVGRSDVTKRAAILKKKMTILKKSRNQI